MVWNKETDNTLPETDKIVLVTNSSFDIVATAINDELGFWIPVGVEAYPRTTSIKFSFDIVYWAEMPVLPKGEK